ncbi:hypothetical protein RclHR1_01740010 [Rhizophagus clarus]|uniref:Reverse transcriptase domain-containing protein n=1 Tax=Rhizophagus clarus TaxID=94130 RepID=A0A2Z6QJY9_9GLOM|nr:hypothetical protein RclHR1_01740010 [Rhizophagus clarus]
MELCLDSDVINKEVTNHFQNAATNLCLTTGDIPAEWRDALLYPILKTIKWEHQLTKIRSITLLETMRKTVVKIVTQKLSHIIADNNILKGGNHVALLGGSTEVPIQIMNLIMEDAKVKKKPLWILFQDLSKAYDRVDIKMLELTLNRIKIPKRIVQLLVNLFFNSKKAVITIIRTTQFYKALIGIDQGKVISPLLWTIYYDPLLCEINKLQLGYTVNQSIVKNVQLRDPNKETIMISSQAYMDDVSWITDSSYKLESILQIADEFNKLNNIQINSEKFALMTNDTNALKNKSVKLNFDFHVQEIQLIHPTESVRILDAWMNLNLSKVYVFNQCKNIITEYNKIIRNKQLTNKMMRYIYNAVIIPSIEYKSQYIILNDNQVAIFNTLARTLFKKKTNLVMTIPNCMIHSSLGYAIKDISTIQLQCQVTRLHNQLQNKGLLGMLFKLSIVRLQQETLSVNNVLTEWKIHLKDLKIKYNLITSTLAIMYDNNLMCQSNIERKIMGGQLPITQVLNPDLLFKKRLNYHLQRISTKGHKPNWYKWIEHYCIINIAMSRKVKSEFIINRQYYIQGSKVSEKVLRKKQWVAFYSDKLDSSHFSRILSDNQTPIIEHWIHNINDDSISLSIQAPVLIKCTGCELKDIQPRSKRKTANNRCLLFIDKKKTINVKAQSIQDTYILDSSVFEYIAMIENRIKYNTVNKDQSSLTIYTNGSFKRHSDTSVMMGSVFKIIETNSIFQCQIQENPLILKLQYSILWILFIKLIRFKNLIVTLQKVKAHDSDDHSNVVDKLAKEACSKECLVIDSKLLAYNGAIC